MSRRTLPGWALLAGDEAWKIAEDAWRRGDPGKLAILLRSEIAIPDEARTFLATVIAGEVKADSRGQHLRRNPAASRAEALHLLSRLRQDRDAMLADLDRIEATAEHRGCETHDVRHWIRDSFDRALEHIAKSQGVSPKTLMNAATPKARRPSR